MIRYWHRRLINFTVGLTVLMAPGLVIAEEEALSWSVNVGAQYSRGDYGSADTTTVLSIPLTFGVQWQRVSINVTLPYVSIDGPGTVLNASSTTTTDRMDRMTISPVSTGEVTPLNAGRMIVTDGSAELGGFYNYEFASNMDVTFNVFKGLSDGSPDWGAGIAAGFSF